MQIGQVLCLNAQSLALGGDAIVFGDPDVDIASSIKVRNLQTQTLNIVCQKNVISQPQGGTNYFCWAGTCYSSSTDISPGTTTIVGGEISDEFSGHFNAPGCGTCSAVVEYCFYPDTDPQDQSCITITYDGTGATSIIDKAFIAVSEFYPNPAKEIVYIDYYLNKPAILIVMDVLGNEVRRVGLSEIGLQRVDISDFSRGIYFGNLLVNNELATIKKLVVR